MDGVMHPRALIPLAALLAVAASAAFAQNPAASSRRTLLMDAGWKFHLGHATDPEKDFGYRSLSFAKAGDAPGALDPAFNDKAWRDVTLPHDWAVELDFVQSADNDVKNHGFKPIGKDYPATSVGWYRKKFLIPEEGRGKRYLLKFDGVFRDCVVWLNGHLLGRNEGGYNEFRFDVTDLLVYGARNVLAVRCDATVPEGWFYEGAGIYRHVWMIETSPLHIPLHGLFIVSEPAAGEAAVTIETAIENASERPELARLRYTILDSAGRPCALAAAAPLTIPAGGSAMSRTTLRLPDPILWDIDRPYLYRCVAALEGNEGAADEIAESFGVRTIRFDTAKGFFLNGRQVKIKGVCCHQDHAGVGSALPDRLHAWRIERLKEMGCNAYRTSHNPPAPELLDACDRLGMLVMDETRRFGSTGIALEELRTMVRRDRNHPSVILWSIGNEEWKVQDTETGSRIARSMLAAVRALDTTRLVTYAANNGNTYDGVNSVLALRGFNYMNVSDIDRYRRDHPEQFLIGSEEASTLCTRGEYAVDEKKGYMSDYDTGVPGWGSTAEEWWSFYNAREWLAGAFVWTGFDYRGEPTPYGWPCIGSHFGVMDACGFPKNNYYYYQSWWSGKDVLHLFPDWNWPGHVGDTVDVRCFTNCREAELFVNGRSAGVREVKNDSHAAWKVPYAPGFIEARGVRDGRTLTDRRETTGPLAGLLFHPDRNAIRADGEDVCVMNLTAIDSAGREIPWAKDLLSFSVTGPARIIGVGNGDPSCHEPDTRLDGAWTRSLFNGRCQVLLQSTGDSGKIRFTVNAGRAGAVSTIIAAAPFRHPPSLDYPIIRHKAYGAKVMYAAPPDAQWATNDPAGALVDGEKGSPQRDDGLWQGFEGNDLDVTIDLGELRYITRVSAGFLIAHRWRIFSPLEVTYAFSKDGTSYSAPLRASLPAARGYESDRRIEAPVKLIATARYIRVRAKNIWQCPDWHRSRGGKARLFADEIVVE